jgi:dipeptidyl aminopeptidase/acylaminoacyl peptidase
VALSPDGRALVFSDCRPRGTLLDVTETPPHPALEEDLPREPCAGPGGRLAFVRDRRSRRVLVVREPSGVTREVTSEALGSPSAPAFDSAGKRLVFQLAEPGRSGIYVVDAEGQYPAEAVTRGEHDTDPIFARDGEIFFTRWDELHNPVVMRTRPGQPELRRALASPRQTVQLVRRSGEILLGSKDKKELFLWDPATGRERRVALGAAEGGYLMAAAVAPDGRFAVVQVGTYGRVLWKIWLDRSARPAERVFEAQLGQSMSSVTITEEGRILVAPRTWLGELHAVLAPAGEVF